MLRRLAREAVIFSLLGMVLTAVGSFVYMYHGEIKSIRVERDQLKKNCDALAKGSWDDFTSIEDGQMTTRSECNLAFGTTLQPLSPEKAPDTLPADFFTKQSDALAEGNRIKNLKVNYASDVLAATLMGLSGFATGFCLWLFYRLVRFAITG
jgi:hypothetical protein